MELLERDGALKTLRRAREAAAEGRGRVAFVTGEPGIGKTALVTRFLADLDPGARVLVGTCDDLSIPRPLGPIRDLAGDVSAGLAEALAAGAPPHDVQSLLIAELEERPRPTVVVLEDVHWADDATFDAITVLGRRIGSLPALLVLTFRRGDAAPGHRLHSTVGAIRADDSIIVELAPLSKEAVATLAGDGARDVYAATAGNPFYVAELLACEPDEVPPSIANAVRGRAYRLDDAARRLVELVSVVPRRVDTTLLDAVMPGWEASAEEPERRQLLEVAPRHVRFRHELARHAIRSGLPSARRRGLHGEILDALLTLGAEPADVVHHAEAAGAEAVVAEYAPVAARRAAAVESNREALSHYLRASALLDGRPAEERAALLEELAATAYAVGRLDEAFPAIERSIALACELGDEEAKGRRTLALSRFHWIVGDGRAARSKALEAVGSLEPLGPSVELARAYSVVSQLAMLGENIDAAIDWGGRALELATRLGDERTRAHALVNIGSARMNRDRHHVTLLEAHTVADAAGDRHEAARALDNLGISSLFWVDPANAMRYARQAVDYATSHEQLIIASYAATVIAWLRLRAGEWDEAERLTRREMESGMIVRLLTKTVLAELAVRRGDPDAAERLEEVLADADRTDELQRIAPALELAVEQALTNGAPMPSERFDVLVADLVRRGSFSGCRAMRVAAWAAVAGVEVEYDGPMSAPHEAMRRRDWRAAAAAFGDVGWTYDRALMLSLLDEEEALAEALETARGLGAAPLTRRAAERMRELGLRVPAGPREVTRTNAAGLTARQLEVLALVVEGLTNAEIAERLVVSPRTAEHHVAAVLTKLRATRRDAAARASELGLPVGG